MMAADIGLARVGSELVRTGSGMMISNAESV
jgi:hypothetical protein